MGAGYQDGYAWEGVRLSRELGAIVLKELRRRVPPSSKYQPSSFPIVTKGRWS
jgi:hypothetical protein